MVFVGGQANGYVPLPRRLLNMISQRCSDVYEFAIVNHLHHRMQHSQGSNPLQVPGEKNARPLRRGEIVTSCEAVGAATHMDGRTVRNKLKNLAFRVRFPWLADIRLVRGSAGAYGGLYVRINTEMAGLDGKPAQLPVTVSGQTRASDADSGSGTAPGGPDSGSGPEIRPEPDCSKTGTSFRYQKTPTKEPKKETPSRLPLRLQPARRTRRGYSFPMKETATTTATATARFAAKLRRLSLTA